MSEYYIIAQSPDRPTRCDNDFHEERKVKLSFETSTITIISLELGICNCILFQQAEENGQ